MKSILSILIVLFGVRLTPAAVTVEPFLQDQSRFFGGTHLETITDIALHEDGLLWVAAQQGLFKREVDEFTKVSEYADRPVTAWATRPSELLFLTGGGDGHALLLMKLTPDNLLEQLLETRLRAAANPSIELIDETVVIACDSHLYVVPLGSDESVTKSYECPGGVINALAVSEHVYWVGTDRGLLSFEPERHIWQRVYPHHEAKSWAPTQVKGLAVTPEGRFGSAACKAYGAGECFAYAATGDPSARGRAKKAFEALKFLGDVTQGGSHPAPPGFVAPTILPTQGRNPTDFHYRWTNATLITGTMIPGGSTLAEMVGNSRMALSFCCPITWDCIMGFSRKSPRLEKSVGLRLESSMIGTVGFSPGLTTGIQPKMRTSPASGGLAVVR